jgi:predicted DNA-binding transcriptional regulator AlpA
MTAIAAEPTALPELIEVDDLAARLSVAPSTIRRWVRDGTIPQPVRLGRRPVWSREVIFRFLNGDIPPKAGG